MDSNRRDFLKMAAIREISPERIVIADGMSWGNEPAPKLAGLGIGQSTGAYQPMFISHHKASWVNSEDYPQPAWPGCATFWRY
jgi:endoglucanase